MLGPNYPRNLDRDFWIISALAFLGVALGGYELIRLVIWIFRHVHAS
jgi:hypothetical protein